MEAFCPDRGIVMTEKQVPGIAVLDRGGAVRTGPAEGENRILEMLSSLDQQLRSISVCGPIELKLCRHVHDT
jgi:hypothetical protein